MWGEWGLSKQTGDGNWLCQVLWWDEQAREPEEILTQTVEGVGKDGFLEEVVCKWETGWALQTRRRRRRSVPRRNSNLGAHSKWPCSPFHSFLGHCFPAQEEFQDFYHESWPPFTSYFWSENQMVVPAGPVTAASSPSWKLGPAVGMGSQGVFQGPGRGRWSHF